MGGKTADNFHSIAKLDDDNIILVGDTKSSDFPVTIKYVEKDSTNLNVMLKMDMNSN